MRVVPDAASWLHEVHRLGRQLVPVVAAAGAWVEDKGATLSIHFREAPDPAAARDLLEREAMPVVRSAAQSGQLLSLPISGC